jgi:hypothetical protein
MSEKLRTETTIVQRESEVPIVCIRSQTDPEQEGSFTEGKRKRIVSKRDKKRPTPLKCDNPRRPQRVLCYE